jgi:hypothetical protein
MVNRAPYACTFTFSYLHEMATKNIVLQTIHVLSAWTTGHLVPTEDVIVTSLGAQPTELSGAPNIIGKRDIPEQVKAASL